MSKHITNNNILIADVIGNVTGDVTGDVIGTTAYATIANGLAYTSTTPSTPTVTWTTGSTTIGGATFTNSTVIPLDDTYGINYVSLHIEFTGTSSPVLPATVKINSLLAAETTDIEMACFNTSSSSRVITGLITVNTDQITVPFLGGFTITSPMFFSGNFQYKCIL